jgi:creatinine amidohydrolase/Fe(II)-dependent formamide hydrolase-like protein
MATKEKGRQIIEALVDEISGFIEDLKAKKS